MLVVLSWDDTTVRLRFDDGTIIVLGFENSLLIQPRDMRTSEETFFGIVSFVQHIWYVSVFAPCERKGFGD